MYLLPQRSPILPSLPFIATLSLLASFILALPAASAADYTFEQAATAERYNLSSRYFNLNNKGITSLTGATKYTNAVNIYLQDNLITSIESNSFTSMGSLAKLNLHNNAIKSIEKDNFAHLTNLTQLLVYENRITSIEKGSFAGMGSLEWLFLHSNKISGELNLSGAVFHNLNRFGVIYGNSITSVNLSESTLSQQSFNTLARQFHYPGGEVESLDLRNADLSDVTSYALMDNWDNLAWIQLQDATLGSHDLDYLTDNLSGLKHLDLSQDQWDALTGDVQNKLTAWDGIVRNDLHVVPEPSSALLASLSLVGLGFARRRGK